MTVMTAIVDRVGAVGYHAIEAKEECQRKLLKWPSSSVARSKGIKMVPQGQALGTAETVSSRTPLASFWGAMDELNIRIYYGRE
jgi:hypothetical protein